jgi:hypothetical protein
MGKRWVSKTVVVHHPGDEIRNQNSNQPFVEVCLDRKMIEYITDLSGQPGFPEARSVKSGTQSGFT